MKLAMIRWTRILVTVVGYATLAAGSAQASDLKIFDDGQLALWGRENPAGVVDPAVPTYLGGSLLGNFKVLESYDKVPSVSSWPLTLADLAANTYLRPTYQVADGSGVPLGTSVVGTASYRTAAGLQFIPSVSRADVLLGGSDRLRTTLTAQFGSTAQVISIRTFPDPPLVSTAVGLTIDFQASGSIALDATHLGNDVFRLGTVSSMFAGVSQYDADAIRWEDSGGTVHTLRLTDATPRDGYLFAAPQEISPGGFFELVKEPGSTWYADSPSMRLDLLGLTGITGRVGIQGWLASTTDPTEDSLSLWLEWMDAPATVPSDASYEVRYSVTAEPPAAVPEPATLAPGGVRSGCLGWQAICTNDPEASSRRMGDVAGALVECKKGLADEERMAHLYQNDSAFNEFLAKDHAVAGYLLWSQGDLQGALAEYGSSLVICDRLANVEPNSTDWKEQLAFAHECRGRVMAAQGDLVGALAEYRKCASVREQVVESGGDDMHSRALKRIPTCSGYVGSPGRSVGRSCSVSQVS